jgi:ubiquinone/menaquinone biosynthesis C-methylase UbiE
MDVNREAIEAWNTILYEKFCRFRRIISRGLGAHGDAALAQLTFAPDARVLDVGCGFGDTTCDIARKLPAGEAVGVDAAENFITGAIRDAATAGVPNARFFTADAQTEDLGGPYDAAFARFGTMFFQSPVAALRNVRKSLRPGANFTMVVWRKREDNGWMHAAEVRVRELVPEPDETNAITCGPGPFSMASADLVSDQLRAAGFVRTIFERFDCAIDIGRDLKEAVDFAMALGPAGEVLRLAGAEAARLEPKIVEALHEVLTPFAGVDGVRAPSSTWIITAQAP